MATKDSQTWMAKNGRNWMGKRGLAPPPPPKKIIKAPPPPPRMPPTFRSLATQAAQSMSNAARNAGRIESNTIRNIGQVASRSAVVASSALRNLGNAESNATQPLRKYVGGSLGNTARNVGQVASKTAALGVGTLESVGYAERKANWTTLQGFNYFFGLPYSLLTYEEYLKQSQSNNPASPEIGYMQSHYTTSGRPVTPNNAPGSPGMQYITSGPQFSYQPVTPNKPAPEYPVYNNAVLPPASPAAPTQDEINAQWMAFWNGQGPRPQNGTVFTGVPAGY